MENLWNYQEEIDKLKQKISCKTTEIENLIHLLNTAYKERDQATHHMETLIHKLKTPHDTPLLIPKKEKFDVNEWNNTFSDSFNHQSIGFIDAVTDYSTEELDSLPESDDNHIFFNSSPEIHSFDPFSNNNFSGFASYSHDSIIVAACPYKFPSMIRRPDSDCMDDPQGLKTDALVENNALGQEIKLFQDILDADLLLESANSPTDKKPIDVNLLPDDDC